MELLLGPALPRLLFLLACFSECGLGHGLHLGTCSVTVHTHELRKHYTEIRSAVIAADSEMGVRLLRRDVMRNIQEGENCCFLRLLLRFFVERVFVNNALPLPLHRRSTSALANSFLTINKNLRQCHCHCGEDTRRTMDSLHEQFDKLEIYQAAVKAIGELDSLLDWLEELTHNSHEHLHAER